MLYKPVRFEVLFQGGLVARGKTLKEVTDFLDDWLGEVSAGGGGLRQAIQRQTVIRLFVALDDDSDCTSVGDPSLQSLSI